jgi:hypothetical protein
MMVEDQLDRRMGRIGGVEKLEEFNEFAASVAILDEGVNLSGQQINAGQTRAADSRRRLQPSGG